MSAPVVSGPVVSGPVLLSARGLSAGYRDGAGTRQVLAATAVDEKPHADLPK